MKKALLILGALTILAGSVPSYAASGDCRPYYMQNHKDGPGSILADIFLLPGTAAVTVLTVPSVALTGDLSVTKGAACVPIAHALHAKDKVVEVIQNFNN